MYRQDRDAHASYARDAGHGQDACHGDDWDDERPVRKRPRKGVFRRAFSLLKVAVLVTPLAVFLYGSFVADCRTRPALTGWTGFIGAGACARNEVVGSAFSMQDNFAILKRLID